MTRRGFLLAYAAASASLLLGCGRLPFGRRRPNLILIVSDTLRADHLGCYGSQLSLTPNMDKLAHRGVLLENLLSCAPVTGAAHASLMTGTYQTRHNIFGQGGVINTSLRTLAEMCRTEGMRTGAFVSNPALLPTWLVGIDRGFDSYDAKLPAMEQGRASSYRAAPATTAQAIAWLRQQKDRQFFLWAHLQEPHGPYDVVDEATLKRIGRLTRPGEPASLPALPVDAGTGGIPLYQALGEERNPAVYRSRYAARAAYADTYVGQLLTEVARLGLDDDTYVVLTSDHGELLGEHDYYFQHGVTVLQVVLHVPFIVAGPGLTGGRRISTRAGTVDLMPTLLELLDINGPADQLQGQRLAPLIRGRVDAEPAPRFAMCDTEREACVVVGNRKYSMRDSAKGRVGKLVNLAADPLEEHDLSSQDTARAADLRGMVESFIKGSPSPPEAGGQRAQLSEEDRRRLKALGYTK